MQHESACEPASCTWSGRRWKAHHGAELPAPWWLLQPGPSSPVTSASISSPLWFCCACTLTRMSGAQNTSKPPSAQLQYSHPHCCQRTAPHDQTQETLSMDSRPLFSGLRALSNAPAAWL